MKKLILDGYNVIHKIPELKDLLKTDLESARSGLANYLVVWKRRNNFSGLMYIVFDGRSDLKSLPGTHYGEIKFVFTPTSQTADDRIISMVKNEKNANSMTVVSDDNYVVGQCKFHGAKVESVQEFASTPKTQRDTGQKIIDKSAEKDINDYLKKEWGI